MNDLISHFEKWQTLYGAFLGGIFALSVALLVASKARRNIERSAAMILASSLIDIVVAYEALKERADKESVSIENRPEWFVRMFCLSPPKISPLLESSIGSVMPVNKFLAAHLELFRITYKQFDFLIERLNVDFEAQHGSEKITRPVSIINADVKNAYTSIQIAVRHANCARILLSQLVLSKFPAWHKIRFRIFPSSLVKDCIRSLETGK